MANYTVDSLPLLKKKLLANSAKIDQYLSDTVNKSTTFARNRSVELITDKVALPAAYVKQRLNIIGRASPRNPRSVISGRTRATLLARYPYVKTKSGVNVRVNANKGFLNIKRAFIINGLRGSLATGIAMRNSVALEYYSSLNFSGPGRNAKIAKLNKLKKKAKRKPNGIHVFHSRSVNQLFDSVRFELEPELYDYMAKDFLRRLKK